MTATRIKNRDWIGHRLTALDHEAAAFLAGDSGILDDDALVPAAVLIAVTDRPEPGVIFTQRTSHMRSHAGQVAFPGGRIDKTDQGPVHAALREAEEEIGLRAEHVDIIGATDPYRTRSGFRIIPVIGIVPPDLAFTPHVVEVDAIFEAPLSHILDPAHQVRCDYEHEGRHGHYYEIMWQGNRIWGATAAMIVNLSARLGRFR